MSSAASTSGPVWPPTLPHSQEIPWPTRLSTSSNVSMRDMRSTLGTTSSRAMTGSMFTNSMQRCKLRDYLSTMQATQDKPPMHSEEIEAFFAPPSRTSLLTDEVPVGLSGSFFDRNGLRADRFVLHPHGMVRTIYDGFGLLILTFDSIGVPIFSAWDVSITGWLRTLIVISMIFWALDVVVNFNTGMYVKSMIEMQRSVIARKYLQSWFVPDILIVATDLFSLIAESPSEGTITLVRISKLSRFFRLLRLARLAKGFGMVTVITERIASDHLDWAIEWVKPVVAIIFINHLQACAWFAVGKFAPSDTGLRWQQESINEDTETTYLATNFAYQYTTSFHWSITQMTPGSMQVFPQNTMERTLNVLCLLIGMVVFSSIISSLSAKLTQSSAKQAARLQQMAFLRRFLRSNAVVPSVALLVEKAANDATTNRNVKPVVYSDMTMVQALPSSLQMRLTRELCFKRLRPAMFRLWSAVDSHGLQTLCYEVIAWKAFLKDDIVFRSNAKSQSAYIVTQGLIRYGSDENSDDQEQDVGAFLCEPALFMKWRHREQALASLSSVLMCIDGDKFGAVASGNRVFGYFVQEFGRTFHTWALDNPSMMSDVATSPAHFNSKVPLSILEMLLPTMSSESRAIVAGAAFAHLPGYRNLRQEVYDGHSVISLDDHGDLVRVVTLQVLEITDSAGNFFTEVGRWRGDWRNDKFVVDVKLPGKKQNGGESNVDVIGCILRDSFSSVAHALKFNGTQVSVTRMQSKTRSVRTKYIMTSHIAMFGDCAELTPASFVVHPPAVKRGTLIRSSFRSQRSFGTGVASVTSLASSPPQPFEMFIMADSNYEVTVYAWLSEDEHKRYQLPEGEHQLASFFEGVRLESSVVDGAIEARKSEAPTDDEKGVRRTRI